MKIVQTCEVCGRTRWTRLMAHSDGNVKRDGVTVLDIAEHPVCSGECADVLFFCAIMGFALHDYLWLL